MADVLVKLKLQRCCVMQYNSTHAGPKHFSRISKIMALQKRVPLIVKHLQELYYTL